MNSDNNFTLNLFIGILYIITGVYCAFLGVSFVNKTKLDDGLFYKISLLFSKIIQGEKRASINNPENSSKYAVVSFVFCLAFLGLGLFVIFGA